LLKGAEDAKSGVSNEMLMNARKSQARFLPHKNENFSGCNQFI